MYIYNKLKSKKGNHQVTKIVRVPGNKNPQTIKNKQVTITIDTEFIDP